MMAKEIQIFKESSSDFTQRTIVENQILVVRIKYNVRNDSWFLNITTENYSIQDLKLVINYPILYNHKALFPVLTGDLIIMPKVDNLVENLSYDNFGNDFGLFYIDASELTEWELTNGIR